MRISVFITSYNQKKYLAEAIESVLAQTLPPVQIIIVDDFSTDGSQKAIADYVSRYPTLITPIYHSKNVGVTQTRIDALQAVTGDYVTYVDGDDRYLPHKLEKESKLLQENPDAKIAFSNNHYMTEDGRHIGIWADEERPPEGDVFCQTFGRDFPRRSLFRMELVDYKAWKQIGFHDPKLYIYEDYDMRIRLTKKLKVVYCDEALSEIRQHGIGLSSSKAALHVRSLEYIYKKNKELLYDLSRNQRSRTNKQFCSWFAGIVTKASIQAYHDHSYIKSLMYSLKAIRYDFSLISNMLPKIRYKEIFRTI